MTNAQNTTRRLFAAIGATALIAVSGSAFAQPHPNNGPRMEQRIERREDNYVARLNDRVAELRERLNNGFDRYQLSRTEIKRLKRDLDKVSVDIRNASRGIRALDGRDFDRFNDRLDRLAARIHVERTDRNRH